MDTVTNVLKDVIKKITGKIEAECMFCGTVFKQESDADLACSVCQKEIEEKKFCLDCMCPMYLCECGNRDWYKEVTGRDQYPKPVKL
jgi:hypothetical protein